MFSPTDLAGRPACLWRYRESLSIAAPPVTFGEGFTPMIGLELGGARILAKLDYLCPTGSYKDRGSTVISAS
jgi:threonine synthase